MRESRSLSVSSSLLRFFSMSSLPLHTAVKRIAEPDELCERKGKGQERIRSCFADSCLDGRAPLCCLLVLDSQLSALAPH